MAMTQPEETTAALVARLHEENRIAYSELARLTHIGAQEAAERERLKRERDEQRARAEKAEAALDNDRRLVDVYQGTLFLARNILGLKGEVREVAPLTSELIDELRSNVSLIKCLDADNRELRQRAEKAEAELAHVRLMLQERTAMGDEYYAGKQRAENMLAERTRERDEARAESLQAGLVGREMAENLDAVTAECVKAQDLAQRHSQDCERALRERDEAREQLAKLEWPMMFGWGHEDACALCKGCKPTDRPKYTPDNYGHRPTCWFAKKDKQITIPAGTLKAGDVVTLRVSFRADGAPGYAIGMKPETVDTTKDAAVSVTATKSEPARPEPRFKVGEKVVTESQPWTITKVVRFNCGPWWYEGDGDTRWQEAAVKPAPKFAVGEWVTWHNVDGEIAARRWSTDLSQWEYALGGTHITEAHLTAQTPQHKQCGAGYAFLGRMTNATDTDWDLWFAKDGSLFVPGPALASDAGNEFHLASAGDKQTRPELIEARRRAVARGLVK